MEKDWLLVRRVPKMSGVHSIMLLSGEEKDVQAWVAEHAAGDGALVRITADDHERIYNVGHVNYRKLPPAMSYYQVMDTTLGRGVDVFRADSEEKRQARFNQVVVRDFGERAMEFSEDSGLSVRMTSDMRHYYCREITKNEYDHAILLYGTRVVEEGDSK